MINYENIDLWFWTKLRLWSSISMEPFRTLGLERGIWLLRYTRNRAKVRPKNLQSTRWFRLLSICTREFKFVSCMQGKTLWSEWQDNSNSLLLTCTRRSSVFYECCRSQPFRALEMEKKTNVPLQCDTCELKYPNFDDLRTDLLIGRVKTKRESFSRRKRVRVRECKSDVECPMYAYCRWPCVLFLILLVHGLVLRNISNLVSFGRT